MHHTTALIARRHAVRSHAAGRALPVLVQRMAIGLVGALLVAAAAWALSRLSHDAPVPKRQVARISVLPDTPPPPPPPPPKEQKAEASKEARPQPKAEPTPQPPAANEPIKMEGAAGDGPSAFAAGAVTNDYRGGPTTGGAASAAAVGDRAAERLYAGTVRQILRDEIERQLSPEAGELSASFALWIAGDGRISRWEAEAAAPALKTALDRSADTLRLPAPPAFAQPMRFKLTVRAGG
ncbi:MAG: hypothetical protein IV094_04015 [Vitreoscilla sp.]|nr:hypothetical protein [Vitreoscilla sp.]